MSPNNNIQTLYACGHAESVPTHIHTHHIGKKIWRMVKRLTTTRSTMQTSPSICRQCTEEDEREKRRRNYVARCAPAARGTNQTLMAIRLAEDKSSVQALKHAQEQGSKQAAVRTTSATIPAQSREQQAAHVRATADFLEDTEIFWRDAHDTHRHLVLFDSDRPYASFAGPSSCYECAEHRDILANPEHRRRKGLGDHLVIDAFDPRIEGIIENEGEYDEEEEEDREEEVQPRPLTRREVRQRDREQTIPEEDESASISGPPVQRAGVDRGEESEGGGGEEEEKEEGKSEGEGESEGEDKIPLLAQLWATLFLPPHPSSSPPSPPHLWRPAASPVEQLVQCSAQLSVLYDADLLPPAPPSTPESVF